jgi:hypothetical protein
VVFKASKIARFEMKTLVVFITIIMALVTIGSFIMAGIVRTENLLVYLLPMAFGWTIIYVLWNAVKPRK